MPVPPLRPAEDASPFRPSPYEPLLSNPHAQTILARYWPSPLDEARFPTAERWFPTEPGVNILAHENLPASPDSGLHPNPPATLLAVHGLAASSHAPYMRRITQRALEAGLGVIRLNVRNCGGTEPHSPTLYHSGLTVDLRRIVEQLAPQPLLIAGFSMGGNIVLKLAGEWAENFPRHVKAVCGISAPVQLGACARRLGAARNRVYEVRFLRVLRRTLETKRRLMPELFGRLTRDRIGSIYEFDDRITAPAFGFRDAEDYYARCSSAAYLAKVRVPALLLQADDDPFIPAETYDDPVFDQNPNLQLIRTPHGGHVAFLAKAAPRFWAEFQALRFFQAALGVCPAEKRKKYWNV